MTDYGYLRLAAAMPIVHIANPVANCAEIVNLTREAARDKNISLIAFPELAITAYTCGDLFGQKKLLSEAESCSRELVSETADLDCVLVFGAPVPYRGRLFNCAIVAHRGEILGIVPKTHLAGNSEFYEPRWFESASVLPEACVRIDFAGACNIPFGANQLFHFSNGACFAVELCQDLWAPVPPSSWASLAGAQVIVNISASNEVLMKHEYRKSLVSSTSARFFGAYLYCSSGYGESTQDLVWAGSSLIYEYGNCLAESERFVRKSRYICADVDVERLELMRTKEHAFHSIIPVPDYMDVNVGDAAPTDFGTELLRKVKPHPFLPEDDDLDLRCREIVSAQVSALCTRLEHIHCRKAVIGISGGLDSTLALIITVLAFDELGLDRKNIVCITMPGFGTSERTHHNSDELMELFGCQARTISIVEATRQHFKDIGHDEAVRDLTYENCQARERTQILMDIAGQEGGIVIGTGDLSELALGWCTYNGDHMSMYGVNSGVPKTLVQTLVAWAATNKFEDKALSDTLLDICNTPISPELVPSDKAGEIAQKSEAVIGPYELNDFYLYNFVRWGYAPEKLLFLAKKAFKDNYSEDELRNCLSNFLRRFCTQQFKRSCIPDGPKVGLVSLSPRGDWRMPSDMETPWKL